MKTHTLNKIYAWLFLIVTLCVAVFLISNRNQITSRIESDLFALLPKFERNLDIENAITQISRKSENTLIIIAKSSTADAAVDISEYLKVQLQSLPIKKSSADLGFQEAINFYRLSKSNLVTDADFEVLQRYDSNDWYQRAINRAYSLGVSALPWKEDPFGIFSNWISDLGKTSKIRPYKGNLIVEDSREIYVILPFDVSLYENNLSERNRLVTNIENSIDQTLAKFPQAQIFRSGMIFHSAAASQQAEREISSIGVISSLAAMTLILLAFRRWIVLVFVLATVGIAFSYAFFMVALLFSKIYLLTLVFGTSLIGMSVDYCLYWLTCSIDAKDDSFTRRRKLYPGMLMALLTTSAAYFLLGITPFSALTQMAVFSISGIVAAWLVVMIFYPMIGDLKLQGNSLVNFFSQIKANFQIRLVRIAIFFLSVIFVLSTLPFIKVDDDVRSLINLDQHLLNDQLIISKIMGLPSPAQFYFVKGESPEQVLKRVEQITQKLDLLTQGPFLKGYQTISQYSPSERSQQNAYELFNSTEYQKALKKLQVEFHLSDAWVVSNSATVERMTFLDWLASDMGKKFSFLWFNPEPNMFATVILLKDIGGKAALQELRNLSDDHVIFVNKTADISDIFSRYRVVFSWLLLGGYCVTFILLFMRYKSDSWRAIVPPLIASALSLGLLTLFGVPIGLLTILGLALVLALGTDYGIFLLEYPFDKRLIFSITMGCLMTVMSFGSLSLSSVPALNSFGLTLFFGVSLSWLFTLLLAKDNTNV
jgi:hypothetical protein